MKRFINNILTIKSSFKDLDGIKCIISMLKDEKIKKSMKYEISEIMGTMFRKCCQYSIVPDDIGMVLEPYMINQCLSFINGDRGYIDEPFTFPCSLVTDPDLQEVLKNSGDGITYTIDEDSLSCAIIRKYNELKKNREENNCSKQNKEKIESVMEKQSENNHS